jgi:protocatechuate 3,4-dioxygenase beta subunit
MWNLLISVSFLLVYPPQKADAPAPSPANLCTVQGVVVRLDTGEPLRKARVQLWSQGNLDDQGMIAITDAAGRFELKGIAPGQYELSAERNGYLRQLFGQTAPGQPASTLTLAPGQTVSDITFRLQSAAVICGHIYDEDGDPVPGAQAYALRSTYEDGRRQFVSSGSGVTNDLGEFRIYGLVPGQYFVQANYQRLQVHKGEQAYLPIYYPGVPDAARAVPISVRPGDEFTSADITLQVVHGVTLRGHIVSPGDLDPGLTGRVELYAQSSTAAGPSVVAQSYTSGSQGSFELRNVPPGAYFLYAFRGELRARQPIEVDSNDIDGLSLVVTPGVKLKGRLIVEGKLALGHTSLWVNLPPNYARGTIISGASLADAVKPDGTFMLNDAFDGDYEVAVYGLPESWFVKSARLDGTDVLTAGVTIDTKQAPGLLEIVVSPNGGFVEGIVTKDEQPFKGGTVTLVPDPPSRGQLRLYKSSSTDQLGHFQLQGIAPGDYKIFAWENIDTNAWTSPEFLQPYETRGESVHVAEGSHSTVNTEVIPKTDPE